MVTSMGKAVLITGCDTGFGHRLAVCLNERGFRVYATVISESSPGAKELLTKCRFSDKIHVWEMDVTNDDHVQRVYEKVSQQLGENGDCLWSVVNNAGIATVGPLEWGSMDDYHRVFAVNTFSGVRVTRTFLPLIKASKGRIVNVVSMLGRFSSNLIGIYCMSKHAMTAFSDTLRRELRGFGVSVSTIEPAFFRTNIADCSRAGNGVERTWCQTSREVQETYGTSYLAAQKQLSMNIDKLWRMGDDIDIVINDMIDAVQNVEPRVRYQPVQGLIARLFVLINIYAPTEWVDVLAYHIDKSVPIGAR